MSLRISRFGVLVVGLALIACNSGDRTKVDEADVGGGEQAAYDGKVECALSGSTAFERTCTTEQIAGPDGLMLVIRHADGGFRRFTIVTDGRGLAPADGFDETRIEILDNDMIEVSSGDDRYRLPALVRGND